MNFGHRHDQLFMMWLFTISVSLFKVSYAALKEGRIWTLVTALFLHGDSSHVMVNLGMFAAFAPELEAYLAACADSYVTVVAGFLNFGFCSVGWCGVRKVVRVVDSEFGFDLMSRLETLVYHWD